MCNFFSLQKLIKEKWFRMVRKFGGQGPRLKNRDEKGDLFWGNKNFLILRW